MRVTKFNTPENDVKKVMLFYNGRFPKETKPDKDVTLPIRLWPNAHFVIYCNTKKPYLKNNAYFDNLFKNCKGGYSLVERTEVDALDAGYHASDCKSVNIEKQKAIIDQEYEKADTFRKLEKELATIDVLWIHHENYNLFGGIVQDRVLDRALITQRWPGKIVIFFNDELFSLFGDFRKFLDNRAKNPNFLVKNPGVLEKLDYKTDWSNVTMLFNEDKIKEWGKSYIAEDIANQVEMCYLSDIILYELPKDKPTIKGDLSNKKGCYVPLFTADRISVCNKIFNKNVDITFAGSRSDDLKEEIKGDGVYIKNHDLGEFLRKHDWTIYLGKGRPSAYLGATFYEPLLKGIPVLMWNDTDPDKKVFPGLDCYFSNEDDIKRIISQDLESLYQKQIDMIWK